MYNWAMHTFRASHRCEAKCSTKPKLETVDTPVAAVVAVPVAIRDVASTGSQDSFSRPIMKLTASTTTGQNPFSISAQGGYCSVTELGLLAGVS